MAGEIVVRPAHDSDSGQVTALIARCWVAYPGNVLDIQGEMPINRAVATGFKKSGGQFWVATLPTSTGDWIVGCVGVQPAGPAMAELVKMYTHPDLRRRGIARRLAALPEQTASRWKSQQIELWSDYRFTEAHAFYQAIGYEQTGKTRTLHDLSNTTEYHFIKSLSG